MLGNNSRFLPIEETFSAPVVAKTLLSPFDPHTSIFLERLPHKNGTWT
jgi:hypothetical protein